MGRLRSIDRMLLEKILAAVTGVAVIVGLVFGTLALGEPGTASAPGPDMTQMPRVVASVLAATTPNPEALKTLNRVRREIIPDEGTETAYGVAFTTAGYNTLLSWHNEYKMSTASASARDFESLDMTLPCCGFGKPSSDESKNCGCGHHQALYGVAKRLLAQGVPETRVQVEVKKWSAYFFPKETLQAELEKRALSDPSMGAALDALKQKGGC